MSAGPSSRRPADLSFIWAVARAAQGVEIPGFATLRLTVSTLLGNHEQTVRFVDRQ